MSPSESIGERIKALRTRQGMTLAGLGEQVNLSTSYLSQVERDKTTPSLTTLTAIARALDVRLRYFFESSTASTCVVRADGDPGDETSEPGIGRRYLSPENGGSKLSANRITLEPGALYDLPPVAFTEELVFVLRGCLEVFVGDEQFTLKAGDSCHYDAAQPHRWCNEGDEPAVVIWSRASSPMER